MALWVERNHVDDGDAFIEAQIARLEQLGEIDGVKFWRRVQTRHRQLKSSPVPIDGQADLLS